MCRIRDTAQATIGYDQWTLELHAGMHASIDTDASPVLDAADCRVNWRCERRKAMNALDARRRFLLGASSAGFVGLLSSGAAVAQGSAVRKRLRILVLNPNTSTDFTKVITQEA